MSLTKDQQRRLAVARKDALNKYGTEYVRLDNHTFSLDVVPSPSLMLDYKLGIGGFPYGAGVEVYGANRLGKSSAVLYPTLANVQKQGKLPCLIAMEPRLVTDADKRWALKIGLDPDGLHILYPDTVEDLFLMLRDLVFGNMVDYIGIDSLGGAGTASSAKEDGKKKAYGISGETTDGLNAIMPRLYKNNQGLMIINQQRHDTSGMARPGMKLYESPGGEALKHHMRIRINLKPGANRYTTKIEGETVLVGRELIAHMKKNNMSEASEKKASFDFFHIETDQYGFGVDTTQDVINVGKITGVLKGGTWIEHETFPNGKLNGKAKVGEFLRENPNAYQIIRQQVLEVMMQNELKAAKANREAELEADVEVTEEEADE